MRHPTDGTLRRLVDEPAGVADADREHVAGCQLCRSGLVAAERDAARTAVALRTEPAADADTDTAADAAWQRLSRALADDGGASVTPLAPARRRTSRLRSPAVAAVGVVALVTGAATAAAADWFEIFRTEEITPVSVARADLVELPDLSDYGDVDLVVEPSVRTVPDAAAAEEATGLTVPEVTDLPVGVTGSPSYRVGDEASAVFTFSAAEAAEAAADAGEALPPVPEGLDGNQFQLVAGPGVAAVWSQARGVPNLVVARGVAPTAYSDGVPFETARDYLLSLPGLPEDLAAQLRSFTGDGTTLPLPVPAELVTTSSAEVDGVPAEVLTSRDGTIAGVVWVEDGVVTAVAGTVSADEVLTVARGLQ